MDNISTKMRKAVLGGGGGVGGGMIHVIYIFQQQRQDKILKYGMHKTQHYMNYFLTDNRQRRRSACACAG